MPASHDQHVGIAAEIRPHLYVAALSGGQPAVEEYPLRAREAPHANHVPQIDAGRRTHHRGGATEDIAVCLPAEPDPDRHHSLPWRVNGHRGRREADEVVDPARDDRVKERVLDLPRGCSGGGEQEHREGEGEAESGASRDPTSRQPPGSSARARELVDESWLDAPVETTLVNVLVAAGYDVWLENWRGSIHAGPNPWTMDQAAVHDHPAAVRAIVDDTGADDIKAVIQCIGSTSFTMSALAGLVPQVSTIVANSVSLHVAVPPTARRKALYLRPIINPVAPYWDPSWGEHPTTPLAHGVSLFVRATHRECKNEVCRMASFIYGAGRPTLWRHENLNGETHDWLNGQFGPAPRQFFDQIARCIKAGHLVSVDGLPELPEDFVAQPPQTDARFVLLAGERNRCFLPVGQRRTFDFLESHNRGRHSLHMIPGYGHLDVFIGRNAHRDTYPLVLRGLEIGVQAGRG